MVTKLATGTADMGTGGLAALLQAKATDNVPVKAVMSIYTMQPDAIFTTKESGINSLKDLQGKTVATATFSSSNVSWPLVLKANGVDADKIKLLKVDPGACADACLGKSRCDHQLDNRRTCLCRPAHGSRKIVQRTFMVRLWVRRIWLVGVRV